MKIRSQTILENSRSLQIRKARPLAIRLGFKNSAMCYCIIVTCQSENQAYYSILIGAKQTNAIYKIDMSYHTLQWDKSLKGRDNPVFYSICILSVCPSYDREYELTPIYLVVARSPFRQAMSFFNKFLIFCFNCLWYFTHSSLFHVTYFTAHWLNLRNCT